MNKILMEQLAKVKHLSHSVDNVPTDDIDIDFSEIVFHKDISGSSYDTSIRVTFADYIVEPFEGFDFHDKFNNGCPPPKKVMYGCIVKETEKMYKFKLHTEDGTKSWEGWCPRKSCTVLF